MDFFARYYHNVPQFMYCPKFLCGQFSPLNLSYDSSKYQFSHQEPGHHFTASLKNKCSLSIRNFPDDFKKWLYSLELKLSPRSTVKISSNNEYSVSVRSPRNDFQAVAGTNSFFISKSMYFDSFLASFSFKFGKPMVFKSQFQDGPFGFGCIVSSSNDSTVFDNNTFFQVIRGNHISYLTFVVCNQTSISKFILSNTVSIMYPSFLLSTTFMIGDGYLFLSSGFKYSVDKLKIGVFGKYKSNNAPRDMLQPAVGLKYLFTKQFATSLVFKFNYFSIGTEFNHNGNILKPCLKFKFDEPAIGFQFSFTSKD